MSELPHVHAPQQGIHTWRDFIVHIAVITIGLLLAIGLQQIVEAVHHRSERAHLEEQMHETFVANEQLIADNLKKLERLQGYLADLRSTVSGRIDGRSPPPAPAELDPRNISYVPPPSLSAYEAAKANGTVALLSFDTIRLYDRVGISIGIMQADHQRFLGAMVDLQSFAERFDSTPDAPNRLVQANLTHLSKEELVEYQVLIGNMIGAADGLKRRLRVVGVSSRAVLDGAQTEAELRAANTKLQSDLSSAPEAVGGSPP
jgi:hypothetical protein